MPGDEGEAHGCEGRTARDEGLHTPGRRPSGGQRHTRTLHAPRVEWACATRRACLLLRSSGLRVGPLRLRRSCCTAGAQMGGRMAGPVSRWGGRRALVAALQIECPSCIPPPVACVRRFLACTTTTRPDAPRAASQRAVFRCGPPWCPALARPFTAGPVGAVPPPRRIGAHSTRELCERPLQPRDAAPAPPSLRPEAVSAGLSGRRRPAHGTVPSGFTGPCTSIGDFLTD